MINIFVGATNSFSLRLNDNLTIENPIFLFELTSVQSNEKFYFTAQDFSTTTRFNNFKVYEVSNTNIPIALTASIPQIQLEYGGSYLYKVYQTDNYSLTPTDVILDSGIALFKNGEYQDFFFELNEDFYKEYVFDEYETIEAFDFEDDAIYSVFDVEFQTNYILTEDGDPLQTEQGDNLIWI